MTHESWRSELLDNGQELPSLFRYTRGLRIEIHTAELEITAHVLGNFFQLYNNARVFGATVDANEREEFGKRSQCLGARQKLWKVTPKLHLVCTFASGSQCRWVTQDFLVLLRRRHGRPTHGGGRVVSPEHDVNHGVFQVVDICADPLADKKRRTS